MTEYDVKTWDGASQGFVGYFALKAERIHYENEAKRLSALCKKLKKQIETITNEKENNS